MVAFEIGIEQPAIGLRGLEHVAQSLDVIVCACHDVRNGEALREYGQNRQECLVAAGSARCVRLFGSGLVVLLRQCDTRTQGPPDREQANDDPARIHSDSPEKSYFSSAASASTCMVLSPSVSTRAMALMLPDLVTPASNVA